jgi:hypothetical protein
MGTTFFFTFYSSPIVRVIKLKSAKGVGHAASMRAEQCVQNSLLLQELRKHQCSEDYYVLESDVERTSNLALYSRYFTDLALVNGNTRNKEDKLHCFKAGYMLLRC